MHRYVLRRLIASAPVLLAVSALSFSLVHLMPGSPISLLVSGRDSGTTTEEIDQLEREFGLDQPLWEQYVSYTHGAVQGDLGTSVTKGRSVMSLIGEALPHTVALTAGALLFAIGFGVSLGVVAAINHRRWPDTAAMFVSLVAVSMPEFWFAIVAVLIFAVHLGLFPTSGTGGIDYLILPAIVLGLRAAAAIARLTRSSMLDTMSQAYIVTAEAKGESRFATVVRHGLRNALVPVITLIGLQFGRLLGGTVIVESIFNRQGLGKLTIDAILEKDIAVLQGAILVVAIGYVLINIAVDVAYAWCDPRIRYT